METINASEAKLMMSSGWTFEEVLGFVPSPGAYQSYLPLYRMYKNGFHTYSSDPGELAQSLASIELSAFLVYMSQDSLTDLIPIYRCTAGPKTGEFIATDQNCEGKTAVGGAYGFVHETEVSGTQPL